MKKRLCGLVIALGLGGVLFFGEPSSATLRGDEVVTQVLSSPQGPASMTVKVAFKVKKGWHVYGLQPGEMGRPPKIKVDLPVGYEMGAAEWPEAHAFTVGEYRCTGYSEDFVVTIPVKKNGMPNVPEKGATVHASWLACDGIACVPGKVQLAVALM